MKKANIDQQLQKVLETLLVTMHHLSAVKRNSAKMIGLAVFTSGRMHFLKNRAVQRYVQQMEELCGQDVQKYEEWQKDTSKPLKEIVSAKSMSFFLEGLRASRIVRTEVFLKKLLDSECPNMQKKLWHIIDPQYVAYG